MRYTVKLICCGPGGPAVSVGLFIAYSFVVLDLSYLPVAPETHYPITRFRDWRRIISLSLKREREKEREKRWEGGYT